MTELEFKREIDRLIQEHSFYLEKLGIMLSSLKNLRKNPQTITHCISEIVLRVSTSVNKADAKNVGMLPEWYLSRIKLMLFQHNK